MNMTEDTENTCLVTMDTVWLGRALTGKRGARQAASRPRMAKK